MSGLNNNVANVAAKRPSNEAALQTNRSKRAKYSVIACEECRNRKLKCLRGQGDRACARCIRDGVHCMMRPHRGHAIGSAQISVVESGGRTRIEKVEEELSLLRRQVAQLTSGQNQGSGREVREPSQSSISISAPFVPCEIHGRVEPHFIGTTHPSFSLHIAEASLAQMGVSTAHHEETHQLTDGLSSVASRYSGRIHAAQQEEDLGKSDQLLLLSLHEVERLFAIFQDEIQRVYPVLHSLDLFTSRIPSLYEHVRSPGLGPYRGTPEQKDVQLLKVVLATALVLEEPARAKLNQELVCSVEDEVGKIAAHPHIDLTEIRIMAVMAIYHFLCDEELYAWRTIGIAGRLTLEMGLHRRQSLLENFADEKERTTALCLFWCVYVLDRQWSLGTGLSFALVDRDIDPELPEIPLDMQYLRCLVGYGRLSSKVWEALPQFGTPSGAIPPGTATLLDIQIRSWCGGIPPEFRLSSPYDISPDSRHLASRGVRNVRTLMYLRGNHLRSLVNRQYVLSAAAIAANLQQARLVVHMARDSIQVLVALSRESDVYARQQAAYNQFLVSALSIVLLATSHAPALFAHVCRKDFSDAIDLVKGFSRTSVAGHRLWKSMRGLVSAVNCLGLGDPSKDVADERPTIQTSSPTLAAPPSMQTARGRQVQGLASISRTRFNPHADPLVEPEPLASGYRDLGTPGPGELLNPNIYLTQEHPNMVYMGSDLMGLFDTLGHGDEVILDEIGDNPGSLDGSGMLRPGEGDEMDQISRFFMGLI